MSAAALPNYQKLTVTYRVEPGCLGPEGKEHIEKFCPFAEKGVAELDSDFIHWDIVPRFSKAEPEMSYSVNGKQLTRNKAGQYLAVFGKHLDEFENHLEDKLALLIDAYFER